MPYEIPDDPLQIDLVQIDLSFIKNEKTRKLAEEAVASLAKTEQHLALANHAMDLVEKQMARIRAVTPPMPKLPIRQLSWHNILEEEEWLNRDMSEAASLARFEEAWHAPTL